jgi:hypothetical protein
MLRQLISLAFPTMVTCSRIVSTIPKSSTSASLTNVSLRRALAQDVTWTLDRVTYQLKDIWQSEDVSRRHDTSICQNVPIKPKVWRQSKRLAQRLRCRDGRIWMQHTIRSRSCDLPVKIKHWRDFMISLTINFSHLLSSGKDRKYTTTWQNETPNILQVCQTPGLLSINQGG